MQDTPNNKQDTDKEVLLILNELQAKAENKPMETDTDDTLLVADSMVRLTSSGVEPVEESAQPTAPAPERKANPFVRLFQNLIPQRGDGVVEVLRKCLFMVALLTLISSAVYLIHDSVWIPAQNEITNNGLQQEHDKLKHAVTDEEYRQVMEGLYAQNNDFRAWLTYEADGEDFLQISLPVLYSGDNDYYLEHDFYKKYNKNGALFFDERNTYTLTTAENKVSIIYGHNMLSGQMFAHLNRFLNGVSYAKAAPTMTLDTFFGTEEYKVFAVLLIDADATEATEFNYLRTSFANDLDFLYYINEIRARSLYTYDSVSVQEDDELLVLSTCTNESQVHMEDGRLAVIARKVRVGESSTVDTTRITTNDNVIMPYAWYTNQELTPHGYYGGSYQIPAVTTRATSEGTTTTTTRETGNGDFETVIPTTAPPVDVVLGQGSIIRATAPTGTKTTTGKTTTGGKKTTTTGAAKATTTTTTTTAAVTTTTTTAADTTAAPVAEE